MFHPNRSNYPDYALESLWPGGRQPLSMREFIRDPRLTKWFAQNYDMVGCNHFSCSDVDSVAEADLLTKVEPIPIGLDFHTIAEKVKWLSTYLSMY